jgi:hypothetical protein
MTLFNNQSGFVFFLHTWEVLSEWWIVGFFTDFLPGFEYPWGDAGSKGTRDSPGWTELDLII